MSIDYGYHYRKWHNDSPEHEARVVEYYRSLIAEHMPSDKNARILDVGCGMGFALLMLRKEGYTNIQGIDLDQGQVKAAQGKGLNVVWTPDSQQFLKEHPAGFDQILAMDLIEHIPPGAQLDFVRALAGALKPGGKIFCTVPNANSALAGRYRYIDWTHHTSFTEHSLDFLLYNGGFRNIRVLPFEKIVRPGLWFLPTGLSRHYWAFKLVRGFRRLEMMTELGPQQGRQVPLSLNIMGLATRG